MTRVPSDILRVTFFTEILKCSWNRIIRVNPLPRGASVGEFRKTCHPRNVEVHEIREYVFRDKEIAWIWSLKLAKSRRCECAVVWSPELSKPRSRVRAMAWNLGPAKLRGREFVKTRSQRLEPMNLQSRELRESVKFGSMIEDEFESHGT
jgi:hypothetical protein